MARARRDSHPLSVIIADLDQLTTINNTYGEDTLRAVLGQIFGLARSTLRQSDWLARYEGQEFAIVLPETHLEGAYAVAERMRRLCAETPVVLSDNQLVVTASFGVACMDAVPASTSDADVILHEADRALGESKVKGRNRVTCGPNHGGVAGRVTRAERAASPR